jgi:hypothetical protein
MKVRDKIINGTFDAAISASKPAQLPKTYQATVTISQKIVLPESGEEEIHYHLVRLDPPSEATVFLSDLSDRN